MPDLSEIQFLVGFLFWLFVVFFVVKNLNLNLKKLSNRDEFIVLCMCRMHLSDFYPGSQKNCKAFISRCDYLEKCFYDVEVTLKPEHGMNRYVTFKVHVDLPNLENVYVKECKDAEIIEYRALCVD